MTLSPTARFAALAVATVFTLSACAKGADPAALAAGDAAFKGVASEGQIAPVAARAVMVGLSGKDKAACGTTVALRGATDVRWSAAASGPAKARVSGDVAPCEIEGDWTGIVFPAAGQEVDDCAVDGAVASAREYQGPCRWGWVESRALTVAPAS